MKSQHKILPMVMLICIAVGMAVLSGCKGKTGTGEFPSGFNQKTDKEKVEYLMANYPPDSVARMLCRGAIGLEPEMKIDTLGMATVYAYEKYTGEDLDRFQHEFDSYGASLPLPLKMKLYFKAAINDPMQLGYQLGLEYVSQIREQHKSVAQIEEEIKEFRKACGSDTETYRRFITGFHIALEEDHGKDLSEDVYRRFINYN
ncbi:MAG: hypothetical protein NC328_04825 [Muribaculum sp.]|nr:hypothetical protein [Muribaculum sp.]